MRSILNQWMKQTLGCMAGIILLSTGIGCGMSKPNLPPPPSDRLTVDEMRARIIEDQRRLSGVDSQRHLNHTYLGVDCTDDDNVVESVLNVIVGVPTRMMRYFNGDTLLKWAGEMENTKSADVRRAGISRLASERSARRDPYTKRYAQIAVYDTDYTVRAAAVRALNYSRSKESLPLYLTFLDDPEVSIRLEAAKALANISDEKAAKKLVEHLLKDDRDVRIACADALRNYHTIDVARVLISNVGDRDFSVAWQARQSLILMTGHDFNYDESAWLNFLTKTPSPML